MALHRVARDAPPSAGHAASLASKVVIALGGVVLLGWLLDIEILENAVPGFVTVKPNTAICLVLVGLGLALLAPTPISAHRRLGGRLVTVAAGIVALLTLSEYVFGIDLGIDQGLFGLAVGTAPIGRMAPISAIGFLLLAASLACLDPGRRWRGWVGPGLALGAAALAAMALVGYLCGFTPTYVTPHVPNMGIPTAIGFLVLAAGIFCARPGAGPMRLLTSDTGGKLVRLLFPAAVALPILLGALRLVGQAAGLFGSTTGMWLFALAIIGLLVPLTWALGASLDGAERERRRAQELGREVQRERVAFEEAPTGALITGADGKIERVNQAFCGMTGYTPDELVGTRIESITHPDEADRASIVRDLLHQGSGTQRFERRYVHRGGAVVECRVAVTAIRDDGGEIAQLFAQIEDITEARRTARELEDAQFEMLARLAAAAELRDDATGRHTRRVGELSAAIAGRLGLTAAQVELIRLAAPLHDIGKLAIPDAIMRKSGALTADEFELVKSHTTIGAEMLAGSPFPLLEMAEQVALTHHERWDGEGYPAGLFGNAIPIAGRIVAVADVYDALTHARPYKPAWSPQDAIAEMQTQAGRHFDPQVLEALVGLQPAPPAVAILA